LGGGAWENLLYPITLPILKACTRAVLSFQLLIAQEMCEMNPSAMITGTSPTEHNWNASKKMSYVFRTPRGKSIVANVPASAPYDCFLRALLEKAAVVDQHQDQDLKDLEGSSAGEIQIGSARNVEPRIKGMNLRRKVDDAFAGRMVKKVRRRVDGDGDECGDRGNLYGINGNVDVESKKDESVTQMKMQMDGEMMTAEDSPTNSRVQSANGDSVNFSEMAYVVHNGKVLGEKEYQHLTSSHSSLSTSSSSETKMLSENFHHISLNLRLRGGMTDRQNRVGSKFGGGGVSSGQQAERERKERLRQLALETVDLAKDPYLMRNHLGTYECKLCLTLHTNEGNYLAHTQGKKHQAGLAKRAAMEAKIKGIAADGVGPTLPSSLFSSTSNNNNNEAPRIKIGRPGYEISKSRHYQTNQRCLSFQLQFPEIESNIQPRHRFMSAFEQRVESPPDRSYQYLLVAAEPYETVAFKIPNETIDRGEGMFVTNWDAGKTTFTVTLYFVDANTEGGQLVSDAK